MKYATLIDDMFLAQVAANLKMRLTKAQGDAIRLICHECDQNGIVLPNQVAYVLGTVYHECRFKAIKEIRAKPGTTVWKMQEAYWHTGFYGRGFCQLTWEKNYLKFSPVIGIDLVKNPDAVLQPEIAAKILVIGMKRGSFTALKLDSSNRLDKYFPADGLQDWLSARKIVNGTFQADKVAHAAKVIAGLLKSAI